MCGISFFINPYHTNVHNKLMHRGPDGSNSITNEFFTMCFDRLAIINNSVKGMQPFYTNNLVLVCNGEIYNYKELARDILVEVTSLRSDVDIISYIIGEETLDIKHVLESIGKLDGDFAFVIGNICNGSFIVARDHVGVRPLFYACNVSNKVIGFASEVKALYKENGVHSIHVFPPCHIYSSTLCTFIPYSFPLSRLQLNKVPSIRSLLERAVEKRLTHSDRPVGLLCSGGVDSALITCIASKMTNPQNMHVFTMEYNEGLSEDSFYAKMLCTKLGFKHTMVKFNQDDVKETIEKVIYQCETYDPNTIRASIPMYLLAKYIAENTDIKVILSGEGSDELFAGYNYFKYAKNDEINNETRRLVKNLHMFDLLRADRSFAAFGLEIRVPYLDQDLVSYVLEIDGNLKLDEKELLRSSFSHLTELRDMRILDRPKERFSDGCGFKYVPFLLNYVCESIDVSLPLSDKITKEKQYYMNIFKSFYGNENTHLIITRELPKWSGLPTSGKDGIQIE